VLRSFRDARDRKGLRDFCQRWLREILASPIDPDPYQRLRRSITLGKLALVLVAFSELVPLDEELAINAAREGNALDGGWYGWAMLGAIQCRTGRLDEALQAIQTSAQQRDWTGGNDLYWFVRAVIRARRGDLARASECYERGRAPGTRRDSENQIADAFHAEAADLLGVKPDPGAAIPKSATESKQPPG
jgi:hypothetical protein